MQRDYDDVSNEVVFDIDEDMIHEVVPSIKIKEEVLKQDASVRLNKDQIIAQITNLVIDKVKNSVLLKNKVTDYANLFFGLPHKAKIDLKVLRPVVFNDKLTYFTDDDDHTQNKEYEQTHFIKSEKLGHFLTQFHSINRDETKQTSVQSANKLYALYAPFTNRETNDIRTVIYQPQEDVDAIRHCIFEDFDCSNGQQETTRLISPVQRNGITYYEGDIVNVIGFFNSVNQSGPLEEFDLDEYVNTIKAFDEGDKVMVAFNAPTFENNGKKIATHANGTIVLKHKGKLTISLKKQFTTGERSFDKLVFDLNNLLANEIFLYPAELSFEDVYIKRKLLTTNMLFRFPQDTKYTLHDIQKYILPSTVGELMLLYEDKFNNIHNMKDLEEIVFLPNNINVDDLPADIRSLLTHIFKKHHEQAKRRQTITPFKSNVPYKNTIPLLDFVRNDKYLKNYEHTYTSFDSLVDNPVNRFRFLRHQQDHGSFYVLNIIKQEMKKRYTKHIRSLAVFKKALQKVENDLDKLDFSSNQKEVTQACFHSYAKEYKKLDKLTADNEKTIYFDKKFDKTPYHLADSSKSKGSIIDKLLEMKEYKNIGKSELEFLADTILKGKRQVRVGDMCVLSSPYGDIVYTRQIVGDGVEMWRKQFRTPFKICTDNPLVNFNDLTKIDTCVKQTFDDVCRSNKNAKVMHKYHILSGIKDNLSNILNLLEGYEQVTERLQEDIETFKSISLSRPAETKVSRTFEHQEHVDYEEYDGDSNLFEDTTYSIDGADMGNFVFVNNASTTGELGKSQVLENQDILNMLLSFIQTPLEEKEFSFILTNVNALYPKMSIEQTLQQLEMAFWKKYNIAILKPTKDQLQLLKDKLNQAKTKKEQELYMKYYFNIIRTMIAYIIILMFIRFPEYVMKVVVPSCVQVLAYLGHPISEKNEERSLVNYFACFLTKISVSDDIRFALFYEKEVNEIRSAIKEAIDEVLNHSFELKTLLEGSRSKIENYTHPIQGDYEHLLELHGFKPIFKFHHIEKTNTTNKKVLNFIKSIQEIVASSKVSKQNILNIPNLFNACCVEALKKDITFFDFFETYSNYKTAKNRVKDLPVQEFIDESLHPPIKSKTFRDIFAKLAINQGVDAVVPVSSKVAFEDSTTSVSAKAKLAKLFETIKDITFVDKKVLEDAQENFDRQTWWDDVLFPKLITSFSNLEDTLAILSDKANADVLSYVKDTIINIGTLSSDFVTVRNTLHAFTLFKLKNILGQVVNTKKISKEFNDEDSLRTDALFGIIASVSNNANFAHVLKKIKVFMPQLNKLQELYFEDPSDDVVVKNILLLSYSFTSFLNTVLKITFDKDVKTALQEQEVIIQDNLKLTATIVNYILTSLTQYMQNTLVDASKLKKTYEELREKRKQELIAAYKVDDEERQLQIALKNMGLTNWADILTGDDTEVTEPIIEDTYQVSKIDEYDVAKNEIYQSFIGEHDDMYGEGDNDEDIMVSYEAYDN